MSTPQVVSSLDQKTGDPQKRNVLVIGSGGREHALAWAASRSPLCADLMVAPGNGGTPGRREPVRVEDPQAVCALAKRLGSDLVIVGPDAAIAAGVIDALTAAGIRAFGPTQAASQLEWSKVAARQFCERNGIVSPSSASFDATELDAAIAYVQANGTPMVVKADGLAAGKGVVVASSVEETIGTIRDMLVGGAHGAAGNRVVLEEVLTGEEVSLLAFCDGTTVSVSTGVAVSVISTFPTLTGEPVADGVSVKVCCCAYPA